MHTPGPHRRLGDAGSRGCHPARGTGLGTPVPPAAVAAQGGAVPVCVGTRPRRGLTLSEPSSGPSWQQRRHRKDLGSRHSVCRVLTKYVPPTFSRTHLEAAAGGDSAPADPAAAPAARGLGGPGAPPGLGLGVRPLGGPSAMAEPQCPPAAIAARAASGPRRFREDDFRWGRVLIGRRARRGRDFRRGGAAVSVSEGESRAGNGRRDRGAGRGPGTGSRARGAAGEPGRGSWNP